MEKIYLVSLTDGEGYEQLVYVRNANNKGEALKIAKRHADKGFNRQYGKIYITDWEELESSEMELFGRRNYAKFEPKSI